MTINLQGLTVSGNLNCQVDLKIISAINIRGSGGNKPVRSSIILNSKMTKVLTVKVSLNYQQVDWLVQQIEDLKKETRRLSGIVIKMTASTQKFEHYKGGSNATFSSAMLIFS